MAVNLSPVGGVAAQFFTNTGAVLTGGKLYTYAAGTTTPAVTYTSSNGLTAWTNPIVLDAAGRVPGSGEIWLTDGINYKFVLKDANDVLIATYDNISGINSNFVAYTNSQEIQTATAGQTVFTLTTMQYQPATNSLSVFVDGVNQYGPGAQYSYVETDSTTVTFNAGLHVGAEVKFTSTQQQGAGAVDASQVTYDPPFTGSVATNVEAKLAQTVSVLDFGAVGDGVTDDTAAIQNAVNACVNKALYFPAGTYKITSSINIASPAFATGETILLRGDGPYNSVISATGDIAAFYIQDSAGVKGGMFDMSIINAGNPYMGGGAVDFVYPASIGVFLRDTFQFELNNVVIEQFGTGLLVQNYDYWSEGTYAENLWCRNNKVGMLFQRATLTGTDSFSHTQILGSKIQIAKDHGTGVWGTGLEIQGYTGGVGAVQIYNGVLQINMWTGDGTGTPATLGSYLFLNNRGRIDCSFLDLTFERFGKVAFGDNSYIANSHTFLASIDPSQIIFEDNNTSKANKFRSRYYGNVNKNLVNMSVANWQGTGNTATMRQGWQDTSTTGYQFGTGSGLSFPFVTSFNDSGNGFFYGTTPDYEDNITWRFKVDQTGRVFPRLTTAYLDATTGASTTGLTAGTIKMRTDTARAVDLTPVWAGIGPDDVGAPLQVIRAAVTASRPSSPGAAGLMFFDTTLGKPIWWTGTGWVDATGASV